MKKTFNKISLFFGLIFIGLGFGIFFQIDTGKIFGFLIGIFLFYEGIKSLLRNRVGISGIVFTLVGSLIILSSFFKDIHFWQMVFPLLLILFGIRMLLKSQQENKRGKINQEDESVDSFDEFVVFGGINKRYTSQSFNGGVVKVIFGGAELDLTNIRLKPESEVKIMLVGIFGGVTVKIPTDIKIKIESNPFLGGIEDKTQQKCVESKEVLFIDAVAVMGGIEIRN